MSRMQIPHGNPVLCNSGHSLPTTVATAPVVITILLPYYCADFYFLTGVCVCAYAQSPLTLCDPFSFRGISQVRILEHVAISYSRGSFDPGIEPAFLTSPALAGRFFITAPPGKPLYMAIWYGHVTNTLLSCLLASSTPLVPILPIHCLHNSQSASFKTWGHITWLANSKLT